MLEEPLRGRDAAVLVSGGMDSAILSVDLLSGFERVFPIYVRLGLRWQETELSHLRAFLKEAGAGRPGLMPLTELDEPLGQVYGAHWSLAGGPAVPGADAPNDSDYLPGYNILLAAKAAVWCHIRGVDTLAFGTLQANPFPDSTPAFFRDFEAVLNRALNGRLRIVRPYARLPKTEVLRRGRELPLHLTFSCIDPVAGRPCGACLKCAERQRVYREADEPDRTPYASALKGERPMAPPDPRLFHEEEDPRFTVARSTIPGAGRGLFARVHLAEGERLEVLGPLIRADSIADACTVYADQHKFRVGGLLLLPVGYGGMVNHSRTPNLRKIIEGDRVYLQALRIIQPGEELFYTYPDTALVRFGLT